MNERDKFLTEVMGKCYHDTLGGMTPLRTHCSKCDTPLPIFNPNFSTWKDFGMLWGWAQQQTWWKEFLREFTNWNSLEDELFAAIVRLVNPSPFADALYKFLKN